MILTEKYIKLKLGDLFWYDNCVIELSSIYEILKNTHGEDTTTKIIFIFTNNERWVGSIDIYIEEFLKYINNGLMKKIYLNEKDKYIELSKKYSRYFDSF